MAKVDLCPLAGTSACLTCTKHPFSGNRVPVPTDKEYKPLTFVNEAIPVTDEKVKD